MLLKDFGFNELRSEPKLTKSAKDIFEKRRISGFKSAYGDNYIEKLNKKISIMII